MFVVIRSPPIHVALIKIDSSGTPRLGPLPLGNTNLRDAAFTVVSHINAGGVSVSVSESGKVSDLVRTLDAMQRAGIKSVTIRTERAPPADPIVATNK